MTDPSSDTIEAPFGEPSRPVFGHPSATEQPPEGLRDRLAVVTGATGLLGAAVAAELSARGAMVCLVGRDLAALVETEEQLGPEARSAVLQCDLAVAEDVVSAVDFVERLDRRVDLVIHAAGLQAAARIADGPVEGLDEHYLLNVRGPYLLSQRLLPLLRDDGAQCVFFEGAEHATSMVGDAHHEITRAAARALASELRAEAARRGIRVVSVVATEEPAAERGQVDPARFAASLASSVADSLSTPDVDVTELRVRAVARPVRVEQR